MKRWGSISELLPAWPCGSHLESLLQTPAAGAPVGTLPPASASSSVKQGDPEPHGLKSGPADSLKEQGSTQSGAGR